MTSEHVTNFAGDCIPTCPACSAVTKAPISSKPKLTAVAIDRNGHRHNWAERCVMENTGCERFYRADEVDVEIERLRPMAESWESYEAAQEHKAQMRSDETTADIDPWQVLRVIWDKPGDNFETDAAWMSWVRTQISRALSKRPAVEPSVRCTCFEDEHGPDCDGNGCCGQCKGSRVKASTPLSDGFSLACENFVPDPNSNFCDKCGYPKREHRRQVNGNEP